MAAATAVAIGVGACACAWVCALECRGARVVFAGAGVGLVEEVVVAATVRARLRGGNTGGPFLLAPFTREPLRFLLFSLAVTAAAAAAVAGSWVESRLVSGADEETDADTGTGPTAEAAAVAGAGPAATGAAGTWAAAGAGAGAGTGAGAVTAAKPVLVYTLIDTPASAGAAKSKERGESARTRVIAVVGRGHEEKRSVCEVRGKVFL